VQTNGGFIYEIKGERERRERMYVRDDDNGSSRWDERVSEFGGGQ
jgi:hypothetical protein